MSNSYTNVNILLKNQIVIMLCNRGDGKEKLFCRKYCMILNGLSSLFRRVD
jgi:hypothetical protein